MANQGVLADTSILIDYFRKTDKSNSILITLNNDGYDFCISAVTEYEIYSGATPNRLSFWEEVLKSTRVLAFDQSVVKVAVTINRALKRNRKQIDLADLFITFTAIANSLPIAILNKKHFERIDEPQIVA